LVPGLYLFTNNGSAILAEIGNFTFREKKIKQEIKM